MRRRIERARLLVQSPHELWHANENHLVRHLEGPQLYVEDAYLELCECGYVVMFPEAGDPGDLRGDRMERACPSPVAFRLQKSRADVISTGLYEVILTGRRALKNKGDAPRYKCLVRPVCRRLVS